MISKNRIRQGFDKHAETYDSYAAIQAEIVDRLIARLPNSAENILEIGCGTGNYSQTLLNQFPESSLLLLDYAPNMIEKTQQRFASYKNIQTICADGENFAASQNFDFITSSMTLHWFSDIKNGIRNCLKYLNPNGKFIFSMMGKNSFPEWKNILAQSNHLISAFQFPCNEQLKSEFPDFTFHTETLSQTFPTLKDFLLSLKKIGGALLSDSYRSISAGQMRQLLRQYQKPISISYEIIYGSYTKP